jgi:lipid-A-disaccharide synthase
MLRVIPEFGNFQFVAAGAPSIPLQFYQEIIGDLPVKIISGSTYELLSHSQAALVTSGTATLEAALLGTPQVVCYKGSKLSYFLAKLVVHVRFISLVNLVMNQEVVRELIQGDLTAEALSGELKKILTDEGVRKKILTSYAGLAEKLGGEGASANAARLMIQYLNKN